MDTERPSESSDATRCEILRHAEDLFGHYGFRKTTMADIAHRAKMSTANLYRYFRNKNAIAIAVIDIFFAQAQEEISASLIGVVDPEARIRAVLSSSTRTIVREIERNPNLMEVVEFLSEDEEAYGRLKAHIVWKRDLVQRALEDGMEAGIFQRQPAYQTAVNLLTATKAFQMPQSLVAWEDPETIGPELEGVFDLIFTGVRAPRPAD